MTEHHPDFERPSEPGRPDFIAPPDSAPPGAPQPVAPPPWPVPGRPGDAYPPGWGGTSGVPGGYPGQPASYGPAESVPRTSPRTRVVAALLTVLALVAISVYASQLLRPDPNPAPLPPIAPVTPVQVPSVPVFPTVDVPLPSSSAWVPPSARTPRPGWQVVASTREMVSYEVPTTSDWTASPGTIIGYEGESSDWTKPNILVVGNTVSSYREGSCDSGFGQRAFVALMLSTEASGKPATLAELLVSEWAGARNTEGTTYPVPPPQPRTVRGVTGAEIAVASITFSPQVYDEYACEAPSMRFTVGVLAADGRDFPIIVVSDQGIDGALPLDVEDEIISTLLPG